MFDASKSRASTERTPKTVFSRIGKNAPRKTRKMAERGPRPKNTIDSGSHAVTGIGRSSDSVGSRSWRKRGILPIASPSGMPSATARRKPP
jgi:hypothetical protein